MSMKVLTSIKMYMCLDEQLFELLAWLCRSTCSDITGFLFYYFAFIPLPKIKEFNKNSDKYSGLLCGKLRTLRVLSLKSDKISCKAGKNDCHHMTVISRCKRQILNPQGFIIRADSRGARCLHFLQSVLLQDDRLQKNSQKRWWLQEWTTQQFNPKVRFMTSLMGKNPIPEVSAGVLNNESYSKSPTKRLKSKQSTFYTGPKLIEMTLKRAISIPVPTLIRY